MPNVKEFYNVFHPCDLVAYRTEPLIEKFEYQQMDLPACKLPTRSSPSSALTRNIFSRIQQYYGYCLPDIPSPRDYDVKSPMLEGIENKEEIHISGHVKRYDYVMQEEKQWSNMVGPAWWLYAHALSYWSSQDFSHFVLQKIYGLI